MRLCALEALLDGLQDIATTLAIEKLLDGEAEEIGSIDALARWRKRWCKPKEFGSTSVERVRLLRTEMA